MTCIFTAAFVPQRLCRRSSSSTLSSSSSLALLQTQHDPFVTNVLADTSSAASTTFEPTLNVPALSAFVFIGVIFSLLIARIGAIQEAAQVRNERLQTLRKLASRQLSSNNNIDDNDNINDQVQAAVLQYKESIERVEALRTIVPGLVRIAPPPSQSTNRDQMQENYMAAKQFLNMDIEPVSSDRHPNNENVPLPAWKVALLLVVASTQLVLLGFLVFADPMHSSTSGSIF